jgi:hypothetical protein
VIRLLALACLVAVVPGCKKKKKEEGSAAVPTPKAQVPAEPVPVPTQTCEWKKGPTTCVGDDVYECTSKNEVGERLMSCDGVCRAGACAKTCALRDVELIYVIDNASNLMRFDPRKLPGDPFEMVGRLSCPSFGPNSMAVDRNGVAWVNFSDGKLFRVSVVDAHCAAEGTIPEDAPEQFGMGFVSDDPKAGTEYLMATDRVTRDNWPQLARIDLTTQPPRWMPVGDMQFKEAQDNNPELTGTGDGKLYAYVSQPGRGYVQEVSRTTGTPTGPRWRIPGKADDANAWAFAHYAGVFYVFVTFDGNSMVYAVHKKTGKVELVKENLPSRIVGAGVSTCAPLLEAPP